MLIFREFMSDEQVENNYVKVGTFIGYIISDAYMGEALGMKRKVTKWINWEQEYSNRGFRTVSLDRFIDLGGYGELIDDVIGKKRDSDEEPIFHARIYKEEYLGKIQPIFDFRKMVQERKLQIRTWIASSTEK